MNLKALNQGNHKDTFQMLWKTHHSLVSAVFISTTWFFNNFKYGAEGSVSRNLKLETIYDNRKTKFQRIFAFPVWSEIQCVQRCLSRPGCILVNYELKNSGMSFGSCC